MARRLVRLLFLVLAAVAYWPLNRRPHRRTLQVPADEAIPLVPIFAVPYLAFLPIYWLAVLDSCLRDRNFRQLADTAILVYGVSNLTYLFFQTHAPRPDTVPDKPGAGLVRNIYSHDRPYCDFPSEHASQAVMFALHLHALRSPLRVPASGLSLTVLSATLLLKQHTIVGTAGGALLAPLVWALLLRRPYFSRPT
jgi:membrane-associated phospholipid phosphatase